jgi:ABC-type antimicrobial peptide transport system permease subunit
VIALTLAAIGLYGVMTYMVSQRRREFGIRLAFGASPSMIAVEILRSAGVLAVVGGAVGLLLAAVASRVLNALIAGVRPSDPATYLLAAGVLLGVALVACLSPGWRAISVDPIEALRE